MDDLHEIESVPTLCIRWLSVQYNNKKQHFGVLFNYKVGTLWSVLYVYCNWRYRQKKKKKKHGSGREWESFFREWNGIFPSFFVGLRREAIKVCYAFWKQEMSPWSNAPPGLRTPVLKDLLLVIIWGSTHILNDFGRIQMSHFNLD